MTLDNAYAERWVLSVKQECLSKMILFGEGSLRRALSEFVDHFHTERNHQGTSNGLLFPSDAATRPLHNRAVFRGERPGGLLNYTRRPPLHPRTAHPHPPPPPSA